MNLEIEVKIKMMHEAMKQDLIRNGAVYAGTEQQHDIYFNSPIRDFSKTDEALRIRSVDGKGEITYKGQKLDTVSKTRPEFNSPADEEMMSKILKALGFFESGSVIKSREIYNWDGFSIGFDTIKGLGEFVEIESNLKNADHQTVQNETDRIFQFLKKYGITKADSIKTSYLEMVLASKE
ncbi:MAG: class IV adenylate cyclase [Methanimicrococcus sp.]|nr:class IV adenylate cyclase [Methanimicrococcus sp.]